jgi:hypothetical protein
MDENVSNSIKTLSEQSNLLAEKRAAWYHQLLVASSALFGILISLHGKSPLLIPGHPACFRWIFAIALALLALGILLTGMNLYSHIDAMSRARKEAIEEAKSAALEGRAMKIVAVSAKTIFLLCEKASYICFGLSVLLLTSYFVLTIVY